MFGKFFASTFTGSMLGAGSTVFAVWGYVIANCQKGTVELNPKLLSTVLGDSVEAIRQAIDFLCAPDADSRSQLFEGRRLVKQGPYFYSVPNHDTYRNMLTDDQRREYFRDKKREQRQKDKALTIGQTPIVKNVTQAEAEADTEAEPKAEKKKAPAAATSVASLPDSEWTAELQKLEVYRHLNVQAELQKAQVWASNNNRVCTRRMFTNWINRAADATRPMQSGAKASTAQKRPDRFVDPTQQQVDAFMKSAEDAK